MAYTLCYDEYQKAIDKLTEDILANIYPVPFDLVVGIARGGCIPAVHLSHRLNIPCRMMQWTTRDHVKKDLSPNLIRELVESKILLVDDIIDSGKTIIEICEFLGIPRIQVTVATLVARSEAPVQPDYCYIRDPDGWVTFWFEQ